MRTFLVVSLAPFSTAWKGVKTVGDLKTAWDAGYDFKIQHGPYCSNRDIETMKQNGIEGVIIKSPNNETIQVVF